METKDIITIVGWFVVFGLGLLSGGVIIPYLTRKRTVLAWAVVSETELVPKELSQSLGVPVTLQVGDERPESLTTATVRLGSAGSETINNLDVRVSFGEQAKILNARLAQPVGEFEKYLKRRQEDNGYRVEADFLNPGKDIELEFLLSEYEPGSVDVDSSAPGLVVQRREPGRWEVPSSLLRHVSVNILGIAYEPAAGSMAQIAEELTAIRRHLRR